MEKLVETMIEALLEKLVETMIEALLGLSRLLAIARPAQQRLEPRDDFS